MYLLETCSVANNLGRLFLLHESVERSQLCIWGKQYSDPDLYPENSKSKYFLLKVYLADT